MHLMFFTAYALKYYTMIRVRIEKAKLNDSDFWYTIIHMNGNLTLQKNAYETFYWLNEGKINSLRLAELIKLNLSF